MESSFKRIEQSTFKQTGGKKNQLRFEDDENEIEYRDELADDFDI